MSQNIINTGQAANDGTGEPLRQAFTDINNNFSQIWSSGPVNSNVQITDNKIVTLQTNQNLVLSPNGIGDVQANTNIIPNLDHLRDLGSSTNRWDTVWAYYLEAESANIGSFGNLTIDVGNLHISGGSNGYVLQTDGNGNLTWTAQTGGGGKGMRLVEKTEDFIDALVKGDEEQKQAYIDACLAVKAKYPKPVGA